MTATRRAKTAATQARQRVASRVRRVFGPLRDTPQGRTATRVIGDLVRIQLVDRSLALAALIFTSVLPVIMAASVLGGWDSAVDAINRQFGVDATALAVGADTPETASTLTTFGLAGLTMVILSGTSFARGLARMYTAIWGGPGIGARDVWRWPVALVTIALAVTLAGLARRLVHLDSAGEILATAAEFTLWTLTWTAVPALLTKGAPTGRALWATGLLTGAVLTAVQIAGRIALPRSTASAEQHFGPLGIAFTSVSWLFFFSMAIVASATVIKSLSQDETRLGAFFHTSP